MNCFSRADGIDKIRVFRIYLMHELPFVWKMRKKNKKKMFCIFHYNDKRSTHVRAQNEAHNSQELLAFAWSLAIMFSYGIDIHIII